MDDQQSILSFWSILLKVEICTPISLAVDCFEVCKLQAGKFMSTIGNSNGERSGGMSIGSEINELECMPHEMNLKRLVCSSTIVSRILTYGAYPCTGAHCEVVGRC